MENPNRSPFRLNRSRIFLLIMGIIVVLIGLSTAMGGLTGYQQLKEADADARQGEAPES